MFLQQFFNMKAKGTNKKLPRVKVSKFSHEKDLIMGTYSNDRPVPQLSIQAKYMHPAIQGATLGVEDLKIAVSNVSSCFQLSQNSMQQIEAALLDMWNRVSCWEVEMDRCPLKHVFPRGRVIFSCPKQNCPRREL